MYVPARTHTYNHWNFQACFRLSASGKTENAISCSRNQNLKKIYISPNFNGGSFKHVLYFQSCVKTNHYNVI